MDKRTRRQHSPEDKVRILRLHLLEHKPISSREEVGIHPTLFYQWQKAFFENGAAALLAGRHTAFSRPAIKSANPPANPQTYATTNHRPRSLAETAFRTFTLNQCKR